MQDFNFYILFKLHCIGDGGATLGEVHHIRSDTGLLEANGGGAALVKFIITPACHLAIGFDAAGVATSDTDSQEPGGVINIGTTGGDGVTTGITTPACHPAIGFDTASVGVSSTDSQEASVGINIGAAGGDGVTTDIITPACRPTIGFDAAGVE